MDADGCPESNQCVEDVIRCDLLVQPPRPSNGKRGLILRREQSEALLLAGGTLLGIRHRLITVQHGDAHLRMYLDHALSHGGVCPEREINFPNLCDDGVRLLGQLLARCRER
jgi:hypothetical protein